MLYLSSIICNKAITVCNYLLLKNTFCIVTWMHYFPLILLWFIYQNGSNSYELWNNTRRYEILHTLNLGCSFITYREPCNHSSQPPRCDIAWLHATNHLFSGIPEKTFYTYYIFHIKCQVTVCGYMYQLLLCYYVYHVHDSNVFIGARLECGRSWIGAPVWSNGRQ